MEGLIFNIQKFSIHDGPGIRTTVFLKGCPLRCKWCANPESQNGKIEIFHDSDKCVQCLSCINTYPELGLQTDGTQIIIPKNLTDTSFTDVCKVHAFSVEGEYKELEDVVEICLQDVPFYEESGGGVTVSGGEGMSQPHFLEHLIERLKEEGIHTAIETTGAVSGDIFKSLAGKIDLILIDVKHYDSKKHKEGTGFGNEQILENLEWLTNQNIEFLCRIPVIPEFNDSLEDAEKFSELFKRLGIKRVQLLPFHQFGEKKYESMNRDYAYKNYKAYHQEELKDYQNIFLKEGIDCFF